MYRRRTACCETINGWREKGNRTLERNENRDQMTPIDTAYSAALPGVFDTSLHFTALPSKSVTSPALMTSAVATLNSINRHDVMM